MISQGTVGMTDEHKFILACREWFKKMPDAEIQKFKKMPESDLIGLHHGFGTSIRNSLIWHLTEEELDAATKELIAAGFLKQKRFVHPDDLSVVVIKMLHEWVQDEI